jgi:hypothetical protein
MVACNGAVDSMLQFQLERGDNGMKHCQKMKRSQQARLVSMERKRDMAQWCDYIGRRRGSTRERKGRRRC